MVKPTNPIQLKSIWKDKGENLWEVTHLLPGGRVELFDRKRSWQKSTHQYQMRLQMASGNLTQVTQNEP